MMIKYIKIFLFIMLLPSYAEAYIGPGAALGLIGSTLGLSWIIILSVALTLAWPIWWVFKKLKKQKSNSEGDL